MKIPSPVFQFALVSLVGLLTAPAARAQAPVPLLEVRLEADATDASLSKVHRTSIVVGSRSVPREFCYGDSSDCRDEEEAIWESRLAVTIRYRSATAVRDAGASDDPSTDSAVREFVFASDAPVVRGERLRVTLETRQVVDREVDQRRSTDCRVDLDRPSWEREPECTPNLVYKQVRRSAIFARIWR